MDDLTEVGNDTLAAVFNHAGLRELPTRAVPRLFALIGICDAVEDMRYELDDIESVARALIRKLGVDTKRCRWCGHTFEIAATGRRPAYCSDRCRVAAHRAT